MPELSTVNVPLKLRFPKLKIGLLAFLFCLGLFAHSQTKWKEGTLLFQRLECGSLCAAIQSVTPSYQNLGFNHAALVCRKGDSLGVVEAIGDRVQWTALQEFLNRRAGNEPAPVMAGIFRPGLQKQAKEAARKSLSYIGRPYDVKYLPDSANMYCTEVIYFSFRAVMGDASPFEMQPMTFVNKKEGKTDRGWEEYYKKLDMDVPEGVPGCNPGQYSLLSDLRIVPVCKL